MASGISEKYRKLLDNLNLTQRGPFTASDAIKIFNFSERETSILLAYFARKGWLSRIRRGLYLTVPLGTINPGELKENPWIVASRVFAPCYIGGWSAAEYWEFTEQIFNSIVVFTTKKIRRKNIRIQGTDFLVKHIGEKYFGKTKYIWLENQKIQVSDPLQTVVDILDDPYTGGGMRNTAEIVREYFASQHRNDIGIVEHIKAGNNRTIYKRLGYLIETLKIDAGNLKEICKKNISAGFSLLDPAVDSKGRFNTKWNLRVNVDITK